VSLVFERTTYQISLAKDIFYDGNAETCRLDIDKKIGSHAETLLALDQLSQGPQ
jgi:hypothetical protein